MLPPVLEIFLVWHPDDDRKARSLTEAVIDHYHGDVFSGLIGGAVEVCLRSVGWLGSGSAPRPIPLPGDAGPPAGAMAVAIVPLLGNGLAAALAKEGVGGPWSGYLQGMRQAADNDETRICLRPFALDRDAPTVPALSSLFGARQFLAGRDPLNPEDKTQFCRDLSQTLTQFLDRPTDPLTVFVSHAKHLNGAAEAETPALIRLIRETIRTTHLNEFFDSNAIQAGDDWRKTLVEKAATSAVLALRSDLYAGRDWCQREVVSAKVAGMPVVVMDALRRGERRGSFLLDHVPRIPAHRTDGQWEVDDVRAALALLVDQCLARALWHRQQKLAGSAPGVDWWADQAPEPLTLRRWLDRAGPDSGVPPIILHPDPPLTPCECEELDALARLAGRTHGIEILTPRTLATRRRAP